MSVFVYTKLDAITLVIYSGSRWREVREEACNLYPARLLLYFIRSGTAIILLLLGKLGKCYLSYIVVSNTMVNSQCLELLM